TRFSRDWSSDVCSSDLDRGRRGHGRGDEVGAAALALPPLEVAVGGRGAALARLEGVRVHAEAHGAAGGPPLGAGRLEDLVEALRSEERRVGKGRRSRWG